MSITKFMRDRRLLNEFNKIFELPRLTKKIGILAEPKSKNYMLIGTAFDYLLRFYITKNNNVIDKNWICEEVQELAKFDNNLKDATSEIIKNAKMSYNTYLKSGELSNNILTSIILIAKLDGISRSGGLLPSSLDVEAEDVQDLKNLFSIIPKKDFCKNKLYFLNPTFGTASLMVGGADADLIIGDTLIDIKTTTKLKFDKGYFLQLIGYYILSELGDIDGARNKIVIKRLGIYYARFGYLFTFKVTDVASYGDIKKFKELFIDIAQGFN